MNNRSVSEPEFNPEIQIVHDRIMTTSIDISKNFEKNHRDVLRSIKDLEISEDYRERNFAPTFREVPGPNGSIRKEPIILITRDGFTILAMGFIGKRAMEFKIKYIEAFNRMEEELKGQDLHSHLPKDRPVPESLERTLERERPRLEAMRLRTDRAMKLKKMILEFREREIFGLAEARQAALSAVSLLAEEDPSFQAPVACGPVVPADEDPAMLADMVRAVSREPIPALLWTRGEERLDSWLLDRGILPTPRNLDVFDTLSRKIFAIAHEIRNRVLEEERRIPPFQKTLEEAARQFIEGREG